MSRLGLVDFLTGLGAEMVFSVFATRWEMPAVFCVQGLCCALEASQRKAFIAGRIFSRLIATVQLLLNN